MPQPPDSTGLLDPTHHSNRPESSQLEAKNASGPLSRRADLVGEEAESPGILAAAGKTTTSTEFYSPMPPGYVPGRHKYVIVMGTVMSGLGKGIFSSSLAKMLKDKGLVIAPIKLEGYLNIDAGTLNPYRHGEVFVLQDGTECDMDLGTYERMLDQNLTRRNFATSGQIYSEILDRERQGVYLGRDVQMIPHVTGEVKRKIRELALRGDGENPADVVFVEVGGTVGDYENGFYIEALRELAFEEGPESCCFVALTYVIEPNALGEQKSKAAQLGMKRLLEAGVQPHLIGCRANNPVQDQVMQKIAMFSNVPLQRVFSLHDRESVYLIPDDMRARGLDREILSILDLHGRVDALAEDKAREQWARFAGALVGDRRHSVSVGITGKYAELKDAYASIDKALEHCSAHLSAEIDLHWIDTTSMDDASADARLKDLDAVIVPGGFGTRGVEGKIACVRSCRENGIPYLGICLGFQVAVIEFARNVLGITGASSTEFDPMTADALISELPDQKKIEGLGGTMRLGSQDVAVEPATLASFLYQGARKIRERFRHRYEVEPAWIERLEQAGLVFSGRHPEHPIMQILELQRPIKGEKTAEGEPVIRHPYFIGSQFHPELTGRPLRPQPMFMGLLAAAIRRRSARDASAPQDVHPDVAKWLPDGSGSSKQTV
ncbi:MAG: CTP synthase [Planctomycetota bacterium]